MLCKVLSQKLSLEDDFKKSLFSESCSCSLTFELHLGYPGLNYNDLRSENGGNAYQTGIKDQSNQICLPLR